MGGFRGCSSVLLTSLLMSAGLMAQAPSGNAPPPVEELVVFGRNANLNGVAQSASQGEVRGADLLVRPMLKVAELLESTPGMVVVQHSGTGKANQYFLRGFNLDHGTDYTAFVDGMPLNMRSHGHGQGYLDMNGLIPETVEYIQYRKGPYYADLGDFSLAGASFINTIDSLEQNFFSTELGQYGWQRLAGGLSRPVGKGTLTLMAEARGYDGPWEHREGLSHRAVWGKYLVNTGFGELEITSSAYSGNWHPTEQIPERAIGTAVCEDEYCSLDDSAGGATRRWMTTAGLTAGNWSATLYGQYYDWEMESNPTYDFQINQFDRRWTAGGRAERTLLETDALRVDTGVEFRHDHVSDVGLNHHVNGLFVSNISDNRIDETSLGVYLQGTWSVTERLRLLGGMRGDYFDFDVQAGNASSYSGGANSSQLSPKFGAAFAIIEALEIYANSGRGFHSNDGRGVVNDLDPVPGLSRGTGEELGLRLGIGDFKFTAAHWWLEQDSELIFVGDSNSVEPKGGSERQGLEFTAFWQPLDWLGIDAVYTRNRARYVDNPEGTHIESAVEKSAQLGFSAIRDRWEMSLRTRYLGPYAMTADNRYRAGDLTTVSWRGAWHWESLTIYGELINLLDNDGKDITYYYGAWIDGLDAPGLTADDMDCDAIDCRMSRATEPRTFRVGLTYKF